MEGIMILSLKQKLLGACLLLSSFSVYGQNSEEKDLLDILLLGSDRAGEPIKRQEEVKFFPSYGHYDAESGKWNIFINGQIYNPDDNFLVRLGVQSGYETFTGDPIRDVDDFWNRSKRFFYKEVVDKSIAIEIAGKTFKLSKSNTSGFWHNKLSLTDDEVAQTERQGDWISYKATARDGRTFTGWVQLISDEGVSVISDIDDTIKVTENANGPIRVAMNTFNRPSKVTPGISELYKTLEEMDAEFHYLTASPWQLHDFLTLFIKFNRLPVGSLYMKDFSLNPFSMEFFELLTSGSSEQYKKEQVAKILKSFPNRKFIMIGDSSQKDPEVYGWAAKTFPDQVIEIMIRNVTDETKNNDRMSTAFGNAINKLKFIRLENGELH